MTNLDASLPNRISTGDYVGPHELHVTVDPVNTDPERFADACSELGIKAHVILNEVPGGDEPTIDYLTGSEVEGRSIQAYTELGRIAGGLRAAGLAVVREKIETTPWHPASSKTSLDRLAEGSYFECHFTLPDIPTIHGFKFLQWGNIPFLISSTESKRRKQQVFATMRHYITTAGEFCENVNAIYDALIAQDIGDIARPTVEFSLYDSNPNHDNAWIDAYRNA